MEVEQYATIASLLVAASFARAHLPPVPIGEPPQDDDLEVEEDKDGEDEDEDDDE